MSTDYYTDPTTGLLVFTAAYHLKRGYCCKSGCRHCPWRNKKVADFCKSCSERIFGEDFKDLADITTAEDTANEVYANVICEGCGCPVLVDHEGKVVKRLSWPNEEG